MSATKLFAKNEPSGLQSDVKTSNLVIEKGKIKRKPRQKKALKFTVSHGN